MRFFITGAGGQLGHDVMNEVNQRGHEAVGSGSKPAYSGVQDGSAVCFMQYRLCGPRRGKQPLAAG